MVCVLQNCLGFRAALCSTALSRRELRQNPVPDIKVTGNLRSGRVADRHLRNLYQAGFNGINQTEIAYHPGKRFIRFLSDASQEIRSRREINAEVDAAPLVNAVKSVDPDCRFLEEF